MVLRTVRRSIRSGLVLAAVGLAGGCRPPTTVPVSTPASQTSNSGIALREVSRAAGVEFRLSHNGRTPLNILDTIGHGAAFLDFNQDGFLDIVLVGPSRFGLWQGDGRQFRDVSAAAGLKLPGHWSGIAAGDYDNDGWPDLLLNGYGCRALLRNEKGRFVDATRAAGLSAKSGDWGSSAAFVDLDHDGLLDLFVCRYAEFGPQSRHFCAEDGLPVMCAPRHYKALRPLCFHNEGGGVFRNVTRPYGFDQTMGRGVGVVPADFNNDGRVDLYVANDTEPGDLFERDADATGVHFTNLGHPSGTAVAPNGRSLAGMGVDAQDYDGDGQLDLVLTTYEGEVKCLWRNNGSGQFDERSSLAGLDGMREWLGWGVGLEDFDNDGFRDLLYVNGHVIDRRSSSSHRYAQPLRLYRGTGGEFLDVTDTLAPEVRAPLVGRGAAFGDYDNDGRVDVLISNLEGSAMLLHNESRAGHWVGVRLRGTKSNRMGLGARVTVEAGGKQWVAEAKTARSVYSACDARLQFGLGPAAQIDRISVRWPSGQTSRMEAIKPDQYVTIPEPNP